MYFLGKLDLLLKGEPKVVEQELPPVVSPEKTKNTKPRNFTKPYNNNNNNNNYDKKPFVKRQETNVAKTQRTQEPTPNSPNTPKAPPSNCYGLFATDGDTFDAMYNNERVTFRLAGIDCPEKNQAYYQNAKDFLKSKVSKKVVYLDFKGVDPYNRQIVEAYEDKEKKISINKQLLEEGYATSERYRDNEGELTHNIIEHVSNKITEVKAKIQDKGIWNDDIPEQSESIEPQLAPETTAPVRKFKTLNRKT